MKKIYVAILIIIISTVLTVFYVLGHGNTQQHKYIYMWQAYVTKKNVGEWEMILHPDDYTGTWRTWYGSGRLRSKWEVRDGKRNGLSVYYHADGTHFVSEMKDDVLNGERTIYDPYGVLVDAKHFKDGKEIGN